jgi:hypothetical protein
MSSSLLGIVLNCCKFLANLFLGITKLALPPIGGIVVSIRESLVGATIVEILIYPSRGDY